MRSTSKDFSPKSEKFGSVHTIKGQERPIHPFLRHSSDKPKEIRSDRNNRNTGRSMAFLRVFGLVFAFHSIAGEKRSKCDFLNVMLFMDAQEIFRRE